ncbi:hypothetical protein PAHAL_6G065700 [Panicum hallii]|uniref:non-specific serine/threonine protein kinase n=1 Tax=Panicum hallii TaxID=206008 RepID=A0A2T8IFJ5_9POAL|nr:hypothetical protein PAHAL_6G065700 [Panicum hallii]
MTRCSNRSYGQVLWLLLACSWVAAARAQQASRTDPVEDMQKLYKSLTRAFRVCAVAALNTILGRWGLRASTAWNISGEPCSGAAVDDTDVDNSRNINPGIKCDCSYNASTVCHITTLRVYGLNVVGQIPAELQNRTYLNNLNLQQNYLTGPLPSFVGKFTAMQHLAVSINPLSGTLPKELGNLSNLLSLGISVNNFTGELPTELGNLTKLEQIYFDSSGFSGLFPSTFSKLKNLKILRFQGNSFEGPIPASLYNLTKLTSLRIGDIVNGSSSLSFISNLTKARRGPGRRAAARLGCARTRAGPGIPGPRRGRAVRGAPASRARGTTAAAAGRRRLRDAQRRVGSLQKQTARRPEGTGIPTAVLRWVHRRPVAHAGSSGEAKRAAAVVLTGGAEGGRGWCGGGSKPAGRILRNCRISDNLATVNFSKFAGLTLLFLGNNTLSGTLPDLKMPSLKNMDFSYNQLSGMFPSWLPGNNLQLNLVANNFILGSSNNSILPSGLNCLQQDIPCFRGSPEYYSFAEDCGSDRSMRGSDNTFYEIDPTNLGACHTRTASYYVTGQTRWGVSNVGKFNEAPNGSYIMRSSQQFQNALNSELFQTARMSPSSLRYYGIGLENGNYTIELQFGEFAYPDSPTWQSTGRRVFDIYLQGDLKEKNFDVRKTVGGKSYTAIHLFWAGKGTCCVPTQGYYGPMISALSVTPNFTPNVRNGVPKKKSKAGAISGIVVSASVLGLAFLTGIFMLVQKRRRIAQQQEEIYNMVGRPNVFSSGELKLATDNFSPQNILGEGGYGPVYKGKLPDGRVVAVKQLSQTSHQGKSQFVTEVATISSVQHRNLVKLYGCCIDSNTPLLVYEYHMNGSLDRAFLRDSGMTLNWPTRFEIILGIARGLTYLHEESSVRIVHRDIKASNVLLDTNLTPKISDFGLAKLFDEKKTHVSTKIAGTFGYLAPEYAMRGHLTEKAHVFAFGVVALETIAGRSNTDNSLEENKIYLFEWAWELYERDQALGILDPRIEEFDGEEALRVIRIALLCSQGSPHQRPPMSRVVKMLTGDNEVTEEVTKPSYITEWQRGGGNTSYVTSDYSSDTTREFSAQRETITPLIPSQATTGVIDEGR